jgi:enoyl-CoA hydratase/carnithine racemase
MTADIQYHAESGIATLAFNRVGRKNSITAAMYAALAASLDAAQADPAVRVVLIKGDESIFSAGNDIGDFLADPPNTADAPVFRFMRAIAGFTKPVVAAVCGPAVGIGTTMLFHCDLVYASENASFSMPFVNLGLCPEAGSSMLAPQALGYHRAAQYLLLGEAMSAADALTAGFVNRVLPVGDVNAAARAAAEKLAAKPLSAVMVTKQLMKEAQRAQFLAHLEHEGETFRRVLGEPAAKEAFTAFVEKRKPDFSKL